MSLSGWIVRLGFGALGAACIFGGGLELQSHAIYSLFGNRVEATLLDRRTVCTFEYQLANESDLRKDPMDCDLAEAAAKANAGRAVRVQRNDTVWLRYTLANGRTRDIELVLGFNNRLPASVANGAVLPILVASDNPNDFRVALTASRMTEQVMLVSVGLLVILFTILGSINRSPRLYRVGSRQDVNAIST